MTPYTKTLNDFAFRTKCNLEIIEKHHSEHKDAYEVTQLINSLLGLIVLPYETLKGQFPAITFQKLKQNGWPVSFLKSSSKPKLDDTLNTLLYCLRNGIAHFHWEATESGGIISGIKIWDQTPNSSDKHWETELSLEDLKIIVVKLSDEIQSITSS